MATIICLLIFIFIVLGPFFLSARICENRNRDMLKGVIVTFFTGWLGTIFLYLALKHRDIATGNLEDRKGGIF